MSAIPAFLVSFPLKTRSENIQEVKDFAAILATSTELQRLHVIPSSLRNISDDGWDHLERKYFIMTVTRDLWTLMKPFACLPISVQITLSSNCQEYDCVGTWSGWYAPENSLRALATACQEGFKAMRKAFAGKTFPPTNEAWEIPGHKDERGQSIWV